MTVTHRAASPLRVTSLAISLLLAFAVGPAFAQKIAVKSATPASGEQGTFGLDVVIAGTGFGNGAKAHFFLSGTENPDGIVVKNTRFVSSTELVATIDIADTASLSYFDIRVVLAGRTGKGTDLFQVVERVTGAPRLCPPPPVDPRFQLVTMFHRPLDGSPADTVLGNSMAAGRSVVAANGISREVVAVGVGTSNPNSSVGSLEVLFLDPLTGALLDGTSIAGVPPQQHLF